MRDESGFTLIELLVSMFTAIVVLGAIMTMTTVATHNQVRIADRVDANQRARPVLTRIVDTLHSGCVAPRVAPVLAGSTPTKMIYISQTGSAVAPTPDKRELTLTPTGNPPTLSENFYPGTGGTAPGSWTYGPPQTRPILTHVSAPGGVMFQYYDYVNGTLNTTPLATPLTDTTAARTAYVTISLTTSPAGGASTLDSKSPIVLTDSVSLRLESAGPVPTQENLPCT